MHKINRIIDVQCHFTTPEYLNMMKRHGAYLEDGFPLPNYSPEQHLEWMDRMSIDYSLLELSSPSPFFHGYLQESIDMYRRLNEYTADLKQKYPKRFGFQAVLPLPDVDAAIEEAIRAIRDLNADGIKFASNARGQYLGAKELEPLMQELDCLGVVCTIHPHRPEPLKEGLFSSDLPPLFEFLADTTRSVLNMISHGVLERYSNIKWIIPHCGSFLPNIINRFQSISEILVPQGKMEDVDVSANIGRLFFDLSGNPAPHLLDFLLTMAKPEQIMYATDYPFTNASMAERNLNQFLEFIENREDLRPYKENILYGNAHRLLFEDS